MLTTHVKLLTEQSPVYHPGVPLGDPRLAAQPLEFLISITNSMRVKFAYQIRSALTCTAIAGEV